MKNVSEMHLLSLFAAECLGVPMIAQGQFCNTVCMFYFFEC